MIIKQQNFPTVHEFQSGMLAHSSNTTDLNKTNTVVLFKVHYINMYSLLHYSRRIALGLARETEHVCETKKIFVRKEKKKNIYIYILLHPGLENAMFIIWLKGWVIESSLEIALLRNA